MSITDRMKRWEGKVAVVTGASGAIGGAIARELVKAGMIVCALARRRDKVEKLRASLFDVAGNLNCVECDITQEEDVKHAFGWIEGAYGGVDLLVNNAGVITKCLLTEKNNTKDLYTTMETNIIGLCLCTREAVKSMKARDVHGHIINVNSIFGHKVHQSVPGTRPLNGMYPASKYAVTAITECIRQELVYLDSQVKVSVRKRRSPSVTIDKCTNSLPKISLFLSLPSTWYRASAQDWWRVTSSLLTPSTRTTSLSTCQN